MKADKRKINVAPARRSSRRNRDTSDAISRSQLESQQNAKRRGLPPYSRFPNRSLRIEPPHLRPNLHDTIEQLDVSSEEFSYSSLFHAVDESRISSNSKITLSEHFAKKNHARNKNNDKQNSNQKHNISEALKDNLKKAASNWFALQNCKGEQQNKKSNILLLSFLVMFFLILIYELMNGSSSVAIDKNVGLRSSNLIRTTLNKEKKRDEDRNYPAYPNRLHESFSESNHFSRSFNLETLTDDMLITTDERPRKNDDEKGNMNELEKHYLPIRNGNESIMEKNNVDIYHANKNDIMENKLNKTIKG